MHYRTKEDAMKNNIIKAFKLYLEVAWFCKTPFVLMSDRWYPPLTEEQVEKLFDAHERELRAIGYDWEPELWDCDDPAAIFKGIASRFKMNAVGIVSVWKGWNPFKRGHRINIMRTVKGLRYVEPQRVHKTVRDYHTKWSLW